MELINFRKIAYFLFLLSIILLFFMESITQAATYNIYFNNSEQGDNSTASPNIVVQDGKMKQKKSDEEGEEEDEESSNAQVASDETYPVIQEGTESPEGEVLMKETSTNAINSKSESVADVDSSLSSKRKNFRLAVGNLRGSTKWSYEKETDFFSDEWSPGNSTRSIDDSRNIDGYSLSISNFVNEHLAGTIFLGSGLYGIEAEISALKLSTDSLELGALIGFMGDSHADIDDLLVHYGARVGVKLGNALGFHVLARLSSFNTQNTVRSYGAGVHLLF